MTRLDDFQSSLLTYGLLVHSGLVDNYNISREDFKLAFIGFEIY